MERRAFLLSAASAAILPKPAGAAGGCVSMTAMGPLCRVYVERPRIIKQDCAQWCWAASAAMIFAMHGYQVDQQRIVQAVFGQQACLPSPSIVMARVLSARWTDNDGNDFSASLRAAYDFGNGINAITDGFIVDEIRNNRPLLYGNGHHAMVLSQVDFVDTPSGPLIQGSGVFDPWPWSPDFHPLSPPELVPAHRGGQLNFLAAVDVH
ncbi:hypothetical protein M0638_05850 [Roseomonas sp. NAR14]|uniref:Papain like cysteine protease AvrRpt2 n=1 Tax=Roseomonas acroporae TaxID=2937791 RepID=A0A9X1Y480_9PROT|nr:hypothetical protein [Roseomonas acroporae]MCK8783904.1 hypothetical protein [Roseomonas acroporae]